HEPGPAGAGAHGCRARRLADRARERPEDLVPDEMPGRVIHGLEAVHVAQHHTECLAVPRRVGDLDLETLEETPAVEHAGEVIVASEPPRLGEKNGVRYRDRGLRRVESDQTLRLLGEDPRAREIRRERSDDLAVREIG